MMSCRVKCSLAVLSFLFAVPLPAQQLEIRFLSVGQGDAALILTPEHKAVLIDAGPIGSPVERVLRSAHIDTVDLVVASHNHADHIGGMPEVLAGSAVKFYLDNGIPITTSAYRKTIRLVTSRQVQYLRPTSRTITVGSVRFRVLAPPSAVRDQNNSSVGIMIEYGRFHALFTGDSELAELEYWLAHESVGPVSVIKVAHHGSANGTSRRWARKTQPFIAVVSVGSNSYGHPSDRVIQVWSGVAGRVFRTDQDGTVDVRADSSGGFTVSTTAGFDCRVSDSSVRLSGNGDGRNALCRGSNRREDRSPGR
jgi:beta-lactamase superfamily II metal-dependent hydrolase